MTDKQTTTEDSLDVKLAELEARMEAQFTEQIEEVKTQRDILANRLEEMEAARELAGDELEPLAIEMVYDPFDEQNELSFKSVEVLDKHGDWTGHWETVMIDADDDFPEGQVLGWKSPRVRADKGWRGWQAILFGDQYCGENGELLTKYLVNPPVPGAGKEDGDFDRHITRKGLVLARLDKRIGDARDRNSVLKGEKMRGEAHTSKTIGVARHVSLVGEGMKRQVIHSPEDLLVNQRAARHPADLARTELLKHNRPDIIQE